MAIEIFENAVKSVIGEIERMEEFRKKHEKAKTLQEDVMKRYYGVRKNNNKPVLVEGITLDRIVNKHGKNGLIIVSANKIEMDDDYNTEKTKELISDLRKSGYSYLPTYGGYKGTNGIDKYEPSFIVFNYKRDGEQGDFDELYNLALEICKKYNQECVLVKSPNNPPIYVDDKGRKVNSTESDKCFKNDPKQYAFTSLKGEKEVNDEVREKLKTKYKTYCRAKGLPINDKGFEKYCEEHWNDVDSIGGRWTYDMQFNECYVNPMPCQVAERLMRGFGEIMIWE